jgi:hypothetical protein
MATRGDLERGHTRLEQCCSSNRFTSAAASAMRARAPGREARAGVEVFGKSRRASGSPPECVKIVFLRHLLVVHELFGTRFMEIEITAKSRSSLIRRIDSLMTRFNSLLDQNNFPVPRHRELGRKRLNLALDSELSVVFGGSDVENPCIFACYQGIWAQRRVRSRLSPPAARSCPVSRRRCAPRAEVLEFGRRCRHRRGSVQPFIEGDLQMQNRSALGQSAVAPIGSCATATGVSRTQMAAMIAANRPNMASA